MEVPPGTIIPVRSDSELLKQAKEELRKEFERTRIEQLKDKLRREKWWHRLIPFTIVIKRRTRL